nr:TIGR03560 family F420-dependent LLM class oxidoreductase [Streptomyces sp. DSM 41633]
MDFRVFVEPQQGATYSDQLAVARAAEALSYSAFFRSDHYLAMSGDGLPGPTDSWVTLAGIARETSTIRLGTMVTSATFRHPGPLAISVAQVDEMSGGRVELGLGAGWFEAEHQAYAIPFPPLGERFDRLEEQLRILTGLWATPVGETFDFSGEHYTVVDSPALPKPTQAPVPIVIGGLGA